MNNGATSKSKVLSKIKEEFSHAPVAFICGIIAVTDVGIKVIENLLSSSHSAESETPSSLPLPLLPTYGTPVRFVALLCYGVLSQNLISYAWYKLIVFISKIPIVVSISLSFIIFSIIAWLTASNMFNMAQNLVQMFHGNEGLMAGAFFYISVPAIIFTLALTGALIIEYDSGKSQSDVFGDVGFFHGIGFIVMCVILFIVFLVS